MNDRSRPQSPGGQPQLPRPARVRDVHIDNHRTRTLVLDAAMEGDPGQFALLWLPRLDEKPFSLRDADPLSFTVAAVGPFSRAVHRLAPGDTVWVRGPFGRGFQRSGTDHLLVGGGYGAAPLLFLARRLLRNGDRVRAAIGAREGRDLLLVDELRNIGAEVHVTTESGDIGERGLVTDVVRTVLDRDPPHTIYACGPDGMLSALESLARQAGVPCQLSWEAYMRCGVGICGSCEHGGLLLCADGPVVPSHPEQR